jgi:SEC-C motif-containing protein
MNNNLCPCHSQKPYAACCKPFHDGALPPTALALMRSRYAAYAKQLADYLIKTTHPSNPSFQADTDSWKRNILLFSSQTQFVGLTIHEHSEKENEAYVTFTAHLTQDSRDVSFTEKSYFKKVANQWLYVNGTFLDTPKS